MIDNIFMDNLHCPKCRGQLNRRKPSKDVYLTVGKNKIIRLWCPCGYYRDETIAETTSSVNSP